MADTGGPVVSFSEQPRERERGTVAEAAPFIAKVEQLMTRVRNAKLRDHDLILETLQGWIDRASTGSIDVARDGEAIVTTLTDNVHEMIRSRTMMRRAFSPLAGLTALAGIGAGVTVWSIAADTLLLGTPLQIAIVAILFGVAGSSFRVLLRTVTFQYPHTDRWALFFTGLARPLVGGVLAMAMFALFGAGIVSLPLVSDQETTTRVAFLAGLGGQGVMAGQLALFAFAFAAGIVEGWVTPAVGQGVSRAAERLSRLTE